MAKFAGMSLNDAISKYSQGDDAYKQKLKLHMRDAMGYSNYMSQIDGALGTPDMGSFKGLSPAGVKERINSKFTDKNREISTLTGIANNIDSTAGGLAADQVAAEKAARAAAAAKIGADNGVAFSPENLVEQKILAYMQNPKNEDGSDKSLQQFESELNAYEEANQQTDAKGYDENGNPVENYTHRTFSAEDIKEAIDKRIPQDYIGNEDKYLMMASGFSEKTAAANAGVLKYDTMSEPEKLWWANEHPEMAKKLENGLMDKKVVSDMLETNENGSPKWTLEELEERNPGISSTDVRALAVPRYKQELTLDIESELERVIGEKSGIEEFAADYNGENDKEKYGLSAVEGNTRYKNMILKMAAQYRGTFTESQIKLLARDIIDKQLTDK